MWKTVILRRPAAWSLGDANARGHVYPSTAPACSRPLYPSCNTVSHPFNGGGRRDARWTTKRACLREVAGQATCAWYPPMVPAAVQRASAFGNCTDPLLGHAARPHKGPVSVDGRSLFFLLGGWAGRKKSAIEARLPRSLSCRIAYDYDYDYDCAVVVIVVVSDSNASISAGKNRGSTIASPIATSTIALMNST